jgi:sugar phosphate isomerase/epimerase
MPARQLAVQLYTLRNFTKTPADIAKTLARVRQMGYHAVQLSALGPIDPKELAKILQGEGLAVAATHISVDRMKNETQAVIEEHALWGCRYTAVGGYFKENPTLQDWLDYAQMYNEVADRFAGSDLRIGYHNHSHELARYDGRTALQILVDRFKPAIWMEIDTYWIQHGGGDAAAWIRKVTGRIPCVHLKDMSITVKREQQMAEVGEGNMNWSEILKACGESGVQWYIVEQDVCQRDPFESLAISLKNLQQMGLQ